MNSRFDALRTLHQRLETGLDAERQQTIFREIAEITLRTSLYVAKPNFSTIHPRDLRKLYELYDDRHFDGALSRAVGDELRFRLSRRMTSAGGKTVSESFGVGALRKTRYEIVISTTLLFQTFHDGDRAIRVTGLPCENRLQALQRIFEHELVHLGEMLVWNDSSCSRPRFQHIAHSHFGHREHTHQLITPRERAAVKFGIRAGDRVQFSFEGRQFEGVVNRITKRATVLVESPRGVRYDDGRMYEKFYVPVSSLRPAPKPR